MDPIQSPQEEMLEQGPSQQNPQEEAVEAPQSPSAISDRNIQMLGADTSLVESINKEIEASERALSRWKVRLIKYYELYQMVQSTQSYESLSKVFVPEILRAVETLVAKLFQMLAGSPNWVEFVGRESSDNQSALAMTELVRYQMEENGFNSRIMDSLRQMLIAGFTVRKVMWDFKQVKRARRTQDGQRIVENAVVTDHWTWEPVDLLSFHISDINTPYNDIQKATWIAEQTENSKDYVYERMRRGWFSSFNKAAIELTAQPKLSQARNLANKRNAASGYNSKDTKDRVELVERWGLIKAKYVHTPEELQELQIDGETPVESVIVIANKTHLLKLEANPFWHGEKPYNACPYVAKEGEFAGLGVAQIGEKLQEELNDTRRQTMDNKTLILSNMWLKGRASGIKNEHLRQRQNGVILTNDMNGLQALRPPVLTGVGVNIEGVVKEDLRQSVGAASNLQGMATSGVDTATESSIINRESLGRLLLTANLYSELMLKKCFQMVEFLNYQYYDNVKMIRVVGEMGAKFKKLSPEALASNGGKDIIINLSIDAAENPAVRRQQIMNFQTQIMQLPPEAIQFHWKLLDKIYGMFFHGQKLTDLYDAPPMPEELLTPEEEIDMVIAEQPVFAKQGQDHQQHLQVLEKAMQDMGLAMSEMSFNILKALINSHMQMLQQELQQQAIAAQAQMQQMALEQGPQGAEGGADMRQPNASPFTQTPAPTTGGLSKQVGGEVA